MKRISVLLLVALAIPIHLPAQDTQQAENKANQASVVTLTASNSCQSPTVNLLEERAAMSHEVSTFRMHRTGPA